jgi:hypothetical protein
MTDSGWQNREETHIWVAPDISFSLLDHGLFAPVINRRVASASALNGRRIPAQGNALGSLLVMSGNFSREAAKGWKRGPALGAQTSGPQDQRDRVQSANVQGRFAKRPCTPSRQRTRSDSGCGMGDGVTAPKGLVCDVPMGQGELCASPPAVSQLTHFFMVADTGIVFR